jgi:hypothetical protein
LSAANGTVLLATIAAARIKAVLVAGHGMHATIASALTSGYVRAFAVGAIIAACVAVVGVLAAWS